MIRCLLFLLVFFTASCNAAREEWSCQGLAFYHGLVAIDRDNGMSLKDRVNKTVDTIIKVTDANVNPLDVEAYDARALINVVYEVYKINDSPKDIYYSVLRSCTVPVRPRNIQQQRDGGA